MTQADIRRRTFADGTWLGTGRGVLCLNKKKRKAENAFSITEKPIWAIREAKIKAERNNRKRLSVVQRKNDN
jgi:16S rRNA G1207 methylase RsmC